MSSTTIRADIAASAQTISPSWAPEGGHAAPTPGTPINSNTLTAMADGLKNVISSSVATPKLVSLEGSLGAASSLTADVETTTTANSITGHVNSVHSGVSVADVSSSLQHFGIADYLVFVVMLIICALIGFYFGFIEKKQKSQSGGKSERRDSEALDYLVGGRKMKVLPVSLSLVASFVSGISLLGTSTEIYVYGTQYSFVLITLVLSGIISWYVFLPVFCNLQLTSTYEYFEMRFNRGIRLFGSVLFCVSVILWLPIVIYVPALAFNQVTGVHIHIVTPIVCLVCIFYTTVGGVKAVIWTDVIQTVVMFGSIILVVIKGTVDVGGLGVVLQRNFESGRFEAPTMTWDPTVRVSVFSIFIGSTMFYVQCNACNQVLVQRYLSLPNLTKVRNALIFFIIGVVLLFTACFYNGLLIFATYHDCDPLTTKLAKAKDQLVPLLVMDILSVLPGMPGLFVSGVFSAALSSLSTGLNSMSAVFLEDFIKPNRKTPLTEKQTAIIMRLTVVTMGFVSVALVFVVERLGTVLQLSMTLSSVTSGPLFGLFIMGLLIPRINGKSALTGSIIAFMIMLWICVKAQIAIAAQELVYEEKPVNTDGCHYSFEPIINSTSAEMFINNRAKTLAQYVYHMSFLFYVPVGGFCAVVFGYIATYFYGANDTRKLDLALFAPCIRRFIKQPKYDCVHVDEQSFVLQSAKSEKFNS